MTRLTPAQRTMHARLAAHHQWAAEPDRSARTATARAAFLARFEREVDPDGELDPRERAQRAESLRRAYFVKLALASSRARSTKQDGGHDRPPAAR